MQWQCAWPSARRGRYVHEVEPCAVDVGHWSLVTRLAGCWCLAHDEGKKLSNKAHVPRCVACNVCAWSLHRAHRSGAGHALARTLVRAAILTAGAHSRQGFVKPFEWPTSSSTTHNPICDVPNSDGVGDRATFEPPNTNYHYQIPASFEQTQRAPTGHPYACLCDVSGAANERIPE